MPKVVALVGASNSGKTTLLEKLIPVLKRRGWRIGTLKHDAHGFDIDHPGKDTYRHREAGADAVVISGPKRVAMMREEATDQNPQALIERYLFDMDLVLVEGFKRFPFPKLEIVRAARSQTPVTPAEELSGLITDLELDLPGVPRFGLDDVEAIADRMESLIR